MQKLPFLASFNLKPSFLAYCWQKWLLHAATFYFPAENGCFPVLNCHFQPFMPVIFFGGGGGRAPGGGSISGSEVGGSPYPPSQFDLCLDLAHRSVGGPVGLDRARGAEGMVEVYMRLKCPPFYEVTDPLDPFPTKLPLTGSNRPSATTVGLERARGWRGWQRSS